MQGILNKGYFLKGFHMRKLLSALCLAIAVLCSSPVSAQTTTQCVLDKELDGYTQCPVSTQDNALIAAGYNGARLEPGTAMGKTPIWVHNTCRFVDAKGLEKSLFIPFNSPEEWAAFVNNSPIDVGTAECCLPRPVRVTDVPQPTAACGSGWTLEGLVDPNNRNNLIATAKDGEFRMVAGVASNPQYPIENLPVARDDNGTVSPISFTGKTDDGVYVARFTCKSGTMGRSAGTLGGAGIQGDATVAYSDFRLQCRAKAWTSEESCVDTIRRESRSCASGETGEIQVQITQRRCGVNMQGAHEQVLLNTCKAGEAAKEEVTPAGVSDKQTTAYGRSPACNNGCQTCVPGQVGEVITEACPSGQTGSITKRNVRTCPSGAITQEVVSNTCACPVSNERTEQRQCPEGKVGSITVKIKTVCGPQQGWGRQPVGVTTKQSVVGPLPTAVPPQTCPTCTTTETVVSNTCVDACTPGVIGTVCDACPPGQTGTITRNKVRQCPSGEIITVDVSNTCVQTCTPSSETFEEACPAGQSGKIVKKKNKLCPTGETIETISNTCQQTCTPTSTTFEEACPAGQSGKIVKKKTKLCPTGESIETISNTCQQTCTPTSTTFEEACPAGYNGKIVKKKTKLCPSGEKVETISNTCTPCPPTCVPGQVGETYEEQCPPGQTGKITKRKVRTCPNGQLTEEVIGNTCQSSCPVGSVLIRTKKESCLGGSRTWSYYRVTYEENGQCLTKEEKKRTKNSCWISPLVVDLANDGLQLTEINRPEVKFDMDLDGKADMTGWIGTGEAFLVLDQNDDGVINSRREMFGNMDGFGNGFEHLASFDKNGDGKIDAKDNVFGKLRLWRDMNVDGVSQPEELYTLAQAKIDAIGVAGKEVNRKVGGQFVSHEGTLVLSNGQVITVSDVWFTVEGTGPDAE
jgi:hypothetical protein